MKWWTAFVCIVAVGCAPIANKPMAPVSASPTKNALIDSVIQEFETGYLTLRGEDRIAADSIRDAIAVGDVEELRSLIQADAAKLIENERQRAFWRMILYGAFVYRKHDRCFERDVTMMATVRVVEGSQQFIPEITERYLILRFGSRLYACR